MYRRVSAHRSGATLNEVLVALGIVAIGVMPVVSLFPLGIIRIQQAGYDTRCTLMARDAKELVRIREMPNDPQLWRWDLYDSKATNPDRVFDSPSTNNRYAYLYESTTADSSYNGSAYSIKSVIAGVVDAYILNDNTEQTFEQFDPAIKSFPILVDPFYVDPNGNAPMAITAGSPPYAASFINIENYYASSGGTSPYANIRVESLAEFTGAGGIAPVTDAVNGTLPFMYRWFGMQGDIVYSDQNPVLPYNPHNLTASTTLSALPYIRYDGANVQNNPTAARTFPYTWAFMIQRNLVADPESHSSTNPRVARPPLDGNYVDAKIRYLCFHRRNGAVAPIIVEACIFDGSPRVTLSWPTTSPPPGIRRGMWLLEASISRFDPASGTTLNKVDAGNVALQSGVYSVSGSNTNLHFRRDFEFYRVADYQQPEIDPNAAGRFRQVIEVTPKPTGYPTQTSSTSGGDLRQADSYSAAKWPISQAATAGAPIPTTPVFYPIVILDGLQEVY